MMNVIAAGCAFPAGPGLPWAACALRALAPFNTFHPYFVDRSGSRVKVARFLEPDSFGVERWLALARSAWGDFFEQLPRPLPPAVRNGVGTLWLALPDPARPGVPEGVVNALVNALSQSPLNLKHYRYVCGGHAAAMGLIHEIEQAGLSRSSFAVVLAVDSWLHPASLQWLDEQGLLHGAGSMVEQAIRHNPYGRIPSEGAAAILLSADNAGWCRVTGVGVADEPILYSDVRPCTGQGLTQAARGALGAQASERRIHRLVCDLNGEPYRADQFGFTAQRISSHLAEGWRQQTPALVTGDVGCATALVHMALTAHELAHYPDDDDHGPRLLLSSSDDALRGAMVLEPR